MSHTLVVAALICLVASASAGCPLKQRSNNRGPSLLTDADAARASKVLPSASFTASGATQIRRMLNKHLLAGKLAMPLNRPCEEFTLDELAELQRIVLCQAEPALVTLAGGSSSARALLYTAETLDAQHASDAADVASDLSSTIADAVRDARCHSLAMAWVHHLSEDGRSSLSNNTMPLLPEKGLQEHTEALKAADPAMASRVLGNLSSAVTCQIGHEAEPVKRGTWGGFPTWPYEVTYNASGYGPYPFWAGGGGSGGSLSGAGADIQTWWSAVINAERLDHSSCSLSSLGGKDGPCTHLFLNGSWAFLYSKDESFCCMSSAPVKYTPCHLTRPQRNFMDVFNKDGVFDYTSEDGLYTGKAKKYSMHLTNPSDFWFWYVTDMDDKPLEQGEGPCDMYDTDGSRNCNGPPKMLFHQYHQNTFKEATIDPAVFERPEVCKKTPYQYCMVQPTNFCG